MSNIASIKRRLKIFSGLFLVVTMVGTVGFMVLEDVSLTESLYYNIVTMSTVGYGDLHPTGHMSRLLTMLIILVGGATFLGVVANATEWFLVKREAGNRMRKVNMVLGVFFSEVGNRLMAFFTDYDPHIDGARTHLIVKNTWTKPHFDDAVTFVKGHDFSVDVVTRDLAPLYAFLAEKRPFLVNLIENPALVEHDAFSDTLLAVFHLLEELSSREYLMDLPLPDRKHLANDMKRVYRLIILEWLEYLCHLNSGDTILNY